MSASPPHRLARILAQAAGILALCAPQLAEAWVLAIGNNNPRRLFLTVGNGSTMADNATVNLVSVTVPIGQVGNGVSQQMTSDSTQANSTYDGFGMCTPPAQVYVLALYQRRNGSQPANARLQVTSPPNLVNAAGDTIPITEISWTVTGGPGDTQPNAIPAGTFNGGTQALVTVAQGTLRDNCHTFHYANTLVRPAGNYDGRVTYTLLSP